MHKNHRGFEVKRVSGIWQAPGCNLIHFIFKKIQRLSITCENFI